MSKRESGDFKHSFFLNQEGARKSKRDREKGRSDLALVNCAVSGWSERRCGGRSPQLLSRNRVSRAMIGHGGWGPRATALLRQLPSMDVAFVRMMRNRVKEKMQWIQE